MTALASAPHARRLPSAPAAVLPAAAALCGLAWGQPAGAGLLGLAALVPLLWHLAPNRWVAGAAVLAFQLAASRGMPASTGIFFDAASPGWFGWTLWLAVGAANAAPWCALWQPSPRGRSIALVAILVLISVPPLGIIGWANPLAAAGILFPHTGFAGLCLLVSAWLVVITSRWRLALAMAAVAVCANGLVLSHAAPAAEGWSGSDTTYGRLGADGDDFLAAYRRLGDVQAHADALGVAKVLVLPETLLGRYTAATARVLQDTQIQLAAKQSVLLVGAELPTGHGRMDNVLMVLGQAPAVIRQRVPIPVGMWRPWAPESFSMHVADRGVTEIAGRRAAVLICYEQLLVFPVLVSFANGADLLVGAANDWWARDTSAPTIQRQVIDTWGRLFGVPVIRATNL